MKYNIVIRNTKNKVLEEYIDEADSIYTITNRIADKFVKTEFSITTNILEGDRTSIVCGFTHTGSLRTSAKITEIKE